MPSSANQRSNATEQQAAIRVHDGQRVAAALTDQEVALPADGVEGGVRGRRRRGMTSPMRLTVAANVLMERKSTPGWAASQQMGA